MAPDGVAALKIKLPLESFLNRCCNPRCIVRFHAKALTGCPSYTDLATLKQVRDLTNS
jgi:hypothetical protein